VAVDAEDRVLVAFGESARAFAAPHSLSVYRFQDGGWTELGGSPVVAPHMEFVSRAILSVAGDGAVFVAWSGAGGASVRRFARGVWSDLPSPGLRNVRAFTVDRAGRAALAGQAPMPGSGNVVVRFDGVSWSAPSSPFVDAGPSPERGVLALAHRGGDVVAVGSVGSKGEAFVLGPDGGWASLAGPIGDDAATRFAFPSLSSGVDGGLALAWSQDLADGGRNVAAATFDESRRTFEALAGPLGEENARFIVVALDQHHRPFVAWREREIIVRAFTDAWRPLPSLGTSGTLPSIALDRRGLPVLSWEYPSDAGTTSIGVARALAD
jgi:hypothetical protein